MPTKRPASPSSEGSNRKETCLVPPAGGSGDDNGNGPKYLEDIIRAPLDTKSYKAIQLGNGLRAILVSTCEHQLDLGNCTGEQSKCKYKLIQEFNQKFVGIQKPSKKACFSSCGTFCGANEKDCVECEPSKPKEDLGQSKDPKIIRCCKKLATVCLTVGVGSFNDPQKFHGLAHITEHCVFLGSQNYPEKGKMMEIAHKFNGTVNAYTQYDHTAYYFRCDANGLRSMLEILSDSVSKPLLDHQAVLREVEAVDSEFSMKQNSDITRSYDFVGYLAKENHPFGTFYWGDRFSLRKPNLPDVMRKWHDNYYKADIMTLCIQGPFPTSELAEMAQRYFSDIPQKNFPVHPRDDVVLKFGEPFDPVKFHRLYHLVPVADVRWVYISWCLPAWLWKDYPSKPLRYIRFMLNSEAEGGLYQYLRDRHWVVHFSSNCSTDDAIYRNNFCSLYRIYFILTEEGFRNRNKVIAALKSYINLLKREGPKEYLFEELRRSEANNFHYHNWESPMDDTTTISVALQTIPPEHVLTVKTLITRFDQKQIKDALCMMDISRANIIIMSRDFEKEECQTVTKNRRFVYTSQPIPPEWYENIEIDKYFSYPKGSNFFPKTIGCPNPQEYLGMEDTKKTHRIVHDCPMLKMILFSNNPHQDKCHTDRLPSAEYDILIHSPEFSPVNLPVISLWLDLLQVFIQKKINKPCYDTLYSYSFDVLDGTVIVLHIKGPSFQLKDYTVNILEVVSNYMHYGSDSQTFEDHKREHIDDMGNDLIENQLLVDDIKKYILIQNHYTKFQHIDKLKEYDLEMFLHFVKRFMHKMFVQVEMFGSVTKEDVKDISKSILDMKYYPFKRRVEIDDRATRIPLGTNILRFRSRHAAYRTTVVCNYYQFGVLSGVDVQIFWMFCKILKKNAYHQLRAEEQLSYNIRVDPWIEFSVFGVAIRVTTQPDKHDSEYVDERIDRFLLNFYNRVFSSEKAYKRFILHFNYTERNVPYKHARLLYGKHFLPNENAFRKLSIQLVGYKTRDTKVAKKMSTHLGHHRSIDLIYDLPKKTNPRYDYIEDVTYFKNSLFLEPDPDDE